MNLSHRRTHEENQQQKHNVDHGSHRHLLVVAAIVIVRWDTHRGVFSILTNHFGRTLNPNFLIPARAQASIMGFTLSNVTFWSPRMRTSNSWGASTLPAIIICSIVSNSVCLPPTNVVPSSLTVTTRRFELFSSFYPNDDRKILPPPLLLVTSYSWYFASIYNISVNF